ncbi:MAG TPA: polysaccharide biosynthesis tyrosine autokinase [Solirubrobacteraceae bacterium]|jgi:capsular exopolysaccharide synthesis family protein|nr:polysaccharide biosynthesis tyrosine autokinase [Solirubrobacteraceae bacterium]
MDTEQTSRSIDQAVGLLRRRAAWIVLCVVLVAGAAYGFSKHQTRKYTANASLVFSNSQLSQQVAGLQPVGSSNQLAQQNTNLKLVQLGDMAAKTAVAVGHGLTREAVESALSVSAQGESNIVNVAVTAISPALAADIANTYTGIFVEEQESSNHAYYASALKLVDKQLAGLSSKQRSSPSGLALQDRAQSLGVLSELRNGSVQIAQAATVPTSPSSPKTSRNTVLGIVFGLLLGLGVAILLERLDRRVREPKDLEAIYDLPLLGVVPESTALSRSVGSGKDGSRVLPAGDAEAFHLIRAHLRYFNVDRKLHTLMVASAAPGDGKTTISRHLAAAAARMGGRVLLLEADLRRPTVARQFDIKSGPGLSDVLIGAASLDEATQQVELDGQLPDGSRSRTLDVLVAGAVLPPNAGELIESHAMESLLQRTKFTYDLVVIDTPPLTAVSDAFPLLGKVDGVIIVGRVGRNRRDVAERLHETLLGAGAPLLGIVANGFKASRLGGAYSYTYDYASTGVVPAADAIISRNGSVPDEEPLPAANA